MSAPAHRPTPGSEMLSVRGLQKTYRSSRGDTEAIRDLTFAIDPGELVCIVGPSGAGKSSLVNDILYKVLANELNGARQVPGRHPAHRLALCTMGFAIKTGHQPHIQPHGDAALVPG